MKIKTSAALFTLALAVPLALLAQSAAPEKIEIDAPKTDQGSDKSLIDKSRTTNLPAAPTVDQTTTS